MLIQSGLEPIDSPSAKSAWDSWFTERNVYMPSIMKIFLSFLQPYLVVLDEALLKYKKELDSLLTLRFQTCDQTQIMNL